MGLIWTDEEGGKNLLKILEACYDIMFGFLVTWDINFTITIKKTVTLSIKMSSHPNYMQYMYNKNPILEKNVQFPLELYIYWI